MSQLERTEAFGPEQWNNASSITGCWPLGDSFPSSCSVELISVMCFSVYVYRRPKGLFVFPLVALWLVSPQTCLKHCYLWPDAFFHRELLNHVNLPSPEFQMQAVEKLAIASAWQVGSISVLSPAAPKTLTLLVQRERLRGRRGPRLAVCLSASGSWGIRPMLQTGEGARAKKK